MTGRAEQCTCGDAGSGGAVWTVHSARRRSVNGDMRANAMPGPALPVTRAFLPPSASACRDGQPAVAGRGRCHSRAPVSPTSTNGSTQGYRRINACTHSLLIREATRLYNLASAAAATRYALLLPLSRCAPAIAPACLGHEDSGAF